MTLKKQYLITRSKSEFINIWHTNSFKEILRIDNREEVLSFAFDRNFIFTCDIKYEIRIFRISDNRFSHFTKFKHGIQCMSVIGNTILLGGENGYIQKIYIEKKNRLNGNANLIDRNYFVIYLIVRISMGILKKSKQLETN